MFVLSSCSNVEKITIDNYEQQHFNSSLFTESLFADNLCVADQDVSLEGYSLPDNIGAAGLFDLNEKKVLYAKRIHEKIYPASITKVLTAYITLKYGNLNDMVLISSNATNFSSDAQLAGLKTGDSVSLYDLLCSLIMHSGNDSAVAIAEHISGSVAAFSELMNKEARMLGATNTHFTNPHGLHEEMHYTTAYDLYLMFNAAAKDQRFLDILSMNSYVGTLLGEDGETRTEEWFQTNYYSQNIVESPAGVHVLGGKTGTTNEAGFCVILYTLDPSNAPYISIITGTQNKTELYNEMSTLLTIGVN